MAHRESTPFQSKTEVKRKNNGKCANIYGLHCFCGRCGVRKNKLQIKYNINLLTALVVI